MKKISPLPSLLTLGNFCCGFISTIFCVQSIYWHGMNNLARSHDLLINACLILFLGMVFDMLDGRVARMTNSASRFGGELDSLADCCSFGIAPALIVATLWVRVQPDTARWWSFAVIAGIVYASCAVLRLARYNTTMDSGKAKENFEGLPSPGAAGMVAASVLFLQQDWVRNVWYWIYGWSLQPLLPETGWSANIVGVYIFGVYLLCIGLLMVSRYRFVHLANLWLGGNKQFATLVLLVFVVAFLLIAPYEVLFLGFNAYLVICLFYNLRRQPQSNDETVDREITQVLSIEDEDEARSDVADAEDYGAVNE